MRAPSEPGDSQFDQNLQRLARHMQMPQRGRVTRAPRWSRRLMTVAGSAAAVVAVVCFVSIVPGFHRVQAGTIFDAFRATLLDGFRLEFEQFGTEDWSVSGELVMLLDSVGERPAVDVFLDASLAATPCVGQPDLALRTTLALMPDRQWAYLELNGSVPEGLGDDPLLTGLTGVLSDGVLLQLNGVWEALQTEIATGRLQRLFAPRGAANELEHLGRALLLGRATPAQLAQLVALVQQAARDVRVERIGADLYALRVARLAPPEGMLSPRDAELLAALEIEIAYRSGHGIRWAEIRHVGSSDGLLRLEPASRLDVQHLFDAGRISPGTTTVLDVPSFVPRLVGLLKPTLPV